jgi:uncharacterized membrane protein
MNTLVVARTIVLNSLGGLVFGWLFWSLGLESAMMAHFLTDVIIYTLIPLAALPDGETERMLATAGVVAVVLLTLLWAGRTLVTGNRGAVMASETR